MKINKAIIIVNSVTMIRVIGTLIIPFMALILTPAQSVIYVSCLLLTDAIDGFLARRLNASTIFGSLLDQVADKILGIVILAVLARDYPIMLLPILTEILIIVVNTTAVSRGARESSSILGKIKTAFLALTIIAGFGAIYAAEIVSLIGPNNTYLANVLNYLEYNINTVMTGVAFISLGTGLMVVCDYYLRARSDIKKAQESGISTKNIKLKTGPELIEALFSPEYYQETKGLPLIKKLGVDKKRSNKKDK